MKKNLLWAALCLIGVQSSSLAQETETEVKEITVTETTIKRESPFNFYVGFGASFSSDFNINEKLAQSGMPQVGNAAPEFTFGFNMSDPQEKLYVDIEAAFAPRLERTSGYGITSVASTAKMRIHYKFAGNNKWFLSGGGDVSYGVNYINLFRRSNTIDLNDLNPDTHTGHISLYNQQLMVGPSVAVGLFQDKVFPIRFNLGYDFGVTNGKWKSEFADVNNTIKENGFGRFYAKVNIGF